MSHSSIHAQFLTYIIDHASNVELEAEGKSGLKRVADFQASSQGAACLWSLLKQLGTVDTNAIVHGKAVANQMLHTGHWKDVKPIWRRLYSIFAFEALCRTPSDEFKVLDLILLVGHPDYHSFCHSWIEILNPVQYDPLKLPKKRFAIQHGSVKKPKLVEWSFPCKPIPRVANMNMLEFISKHMELEQPVIVTDFVTTWPATERWQDKDYLMDVAKDRTVPIEIGRYDKEDWGQKTMLFGDFLELIESEHSSSNMPYLAQTTLFEQIPQLKKDIIVPELTSLETNAYSDQFLQADYPITTNAWFGPSGTISPCHQDRFHNFLCQVVGRKRIVLFHRKYHAELYPHSGTILYNTSQIQLEDVDYTQYPEFKKVDTAYVCELNAGEMLYIPPKWWHYVESLEISFSVNFWWGVPRV